MDNQDSARSKLDLLEEVISLRGKIARLERSIEKQEVEVGSAATAIEAWNRRDGSAANAAVVRAQILGRVAGTVLHDLNNIFTVIVGNVELLRDPGVPAGFDEEQAKLFEEIESSVTAGAALTRRWLGICARTSSEAVSFDPVSVLERLERPLALVTEAPVEVAASGGERAPRTRVMSQERFEHAILTLAVMNAEASQPGSSILVHGSVETEESGSIYAMRIESHGEARVDRYESPSSKEHEIDALNRWARSLGGALAQESLSPNYRGFELRIPLL